MRLAGRATQGVRLIDLKKRNDIISSVCQVPSSTEEDEDEIEQVLNEDPEYTSDNVTDTTDSINDSSDGDVVENADI